MSPIRVVHLTSVHAYRDTRILDKECQTLAAHGYEVSLVAPGAPDEMYGEVRLIGVPLPANRVTRILFTTWRVVFAAMACRAQVYHLHDPELLPLAWVLRRSGAIVIFDAHENFGALIRTKAWLPAPFRGIAARAYELIERVTRPSIDAVVVASEAIGQSVSHPTKCRVRYFPSRDEYVETEEGPKERSASLVWAGSTSKDRGALEMVRAVAELRDLPAVRLTLAGRLSPPTLLKELESEEGWSRTEHLGWVPPEVVSELYASASVGLCIIRPSSRNSMEGHPRKLYEYMAAGLPVVASSFPEWSELILGEGVGLVADPLDPRDIAQKVREILDDPAEARAMGRRGRELVRSRLNWETESRELLALYESLLESRSGLTAAAPRSPGSTASPTSR